ncbi:uncharacterized protein LOC113315803 [Papaver somniferum]|uniref:uncharacterized protein LOC113315803 n=1 Tax=Papaver somniferum TaxID=3469 RepID=UPI000E6FEF03|nr:uncharacterized protein LOC113315803 [Papaver somniferum]
MVRKKRNSIVMLQNDIGEWINSAKDIDSHIVNHFCDLFSSSNSDVLDNEISSLFPPSITADHNVQLTREVGIDEIKIIIHQMDSLKSPGPDELQVYMHISLCNFSMKIITKIKTNRVRPLISKIVSHNHHAFIPGRDLFDPTNICNDIIQSFKARKGEKGWMALKLDFDKFISSVSFQVLINGFPSSSFRPSNGLRQGDPLSSFHFILCLESLTRLINVIYKNTLNLRSLVDKFFSWIGQRISKSTFLLLPTWVRALPEG